MQITKDYYLEKEILNAQKLLLATAPPGPLSRNSIQETLRCLAKDEILPDPKPLSEREISAFKKNFEKVIRLSSLETILDTIEKFPSLLNTEKQIKKTLNQFKPTTSLIKNKKSATSINSLIRDNPLFNSEEHALFRAISKELAANKILELTKIELTYIELIHNRLDSISIQPQQEAEFMNTLDFLLTRPIYQDIIWPSFMEPVADLLLNTDLYAETKEDQEAFIELILEEINAFKNSRRTEEKDSLPCSL